MNPEQGALPFPALHTNRASMDLRDMADDCQPKTCPALLPASGFIDPVETLEKAGQLGGGDAGAIIPDLDTNKVIGLLGKDRDSPGSGRVFDCVIQEIENCLDYEAAVYCDDDIVRASSST